MSDFQVGDRVSVEGEVIKVFDECLVLTIDTSRYFRREEVTLVERPKRKLRVGSVWECTNGLRYVVTPQGRFADQNGHLERDQLSFDAHPELWREVPVEELEAEAQG